MYHLSLSDARKVVAPPAGLRITKNANGITSDIIASVRQVFAESRQQTAQLSEILKGRSDLETARNIFQFVRSNVLYKLDPANVQFIRTPADIIHNGIADCKGLAILINSLLSNAGIKNAFRFVSFSQVPTVTHVYALAFIGGQTYILDACLPKFNEEKPYTFKQDHMTQIVHVSGFGVAAQANRARRKRGTFRRPVTVLPGTELAAGETPLNISGLETEGLMDLKLHRQSLEIDRANIAEIHGIGSEAVADYNEGIAAISAAIAAYEDNNHAAVAGIGAAIGKKAKKKKGGFFKKVAAGVKKVAKKAVDVHKKVLKLSVKAATLPARLTIKAMAEVILPKIAPFFLYLFVTNPTTISKLPANVQRKRKKSEKFAKFMTKTVGMKEAHFMKIISNGIKRKYRKTPEQLLSEKLKGQPISGIGIAPLIALIPTILELIGKLAKVFGKKPAADETPTADDAPDLDNDFAEMVPQEARKLVAHLTHKPESQTYQVPADAAEDSRQERAEQSVTRQIDYEPVETPVEAPLPNPEPEPGDSGNFKTADPASPDGSAEIETEAGQESSPAPTGQSSSKLPLIAAAAAAGFLLLKK